MNFLKDKVRKYQEKKLLEAQDKIKFHTKIKNHLEKDLKKYNGGNISNLKTEIKKQDEFIKIWEKNVNSIKNQIKKLDK